MTTIFLNDKPLTTQAKTLEELAKELQLPALPLAAVLNQQVIGKALWPDTKLTEHCKLSFFQLVAGG